MLTKSKTGLPSWQATSHPARLEVLRVFPRKKWAGGGVGARQGSGKDEESRRDLAKDGLSTVCRAGGLPLGPHLAEQSQDADRGLL